jgi:hypothetical protein
MEKTRTWNKPTQVQPSGFWQKSQELTLEKRPTNGVGKTGYELVEDWN